LCEQAYDLQVLRERVLLVLPVAWNVLAGGTCLLLIKGIVQGDVVATPFVRIVAAIVLAGIAFEHAERLRASRRRRSKEPEPDSKMQ